MDDHAAGESIAEAIERAARHADGCLSHGDQPELSIRGERESVLPGGDRGTVGTMGAVGGEGARHGAARVRGVERGRVNSAKVAPPATPGRRGALSCCGHHAANRITTRRGISLPRS
jgi:hypothetical protein